jgi:hypothetical protein
MRASSLKKKAEYGIITREILEEIFTRRLLAADLLSRAEGKATSHAAKMVRTTLEAVRAELEGKIS